MLDNVKQVSGRKGGGKGGGSSRTPYEAPDNLLTDSTAYLIDVVSEGEIEGWADPENPGTCIYFDDTPLQNPDGSYNFEGVEYWLRTGTPDQEPVPGFSAVENEVGVSVLVEQQQPVVRSITAADVDAARIKVGVASLSTLNTETGDLTEAKVDFAIEMQAGSGGWETVGSYSISGKTTSGYQRAYRVELPEVRPVAIRVRRITPDSESSNIQNDLFFVSYTEVIDAKLRYPDTAYVALAVPASAFGGRIPRRSYRLKGVKCWVPSNYDPVARTYDETSIWDGTFKHAFTRNPAFLTYTVLLENRWGLGERIAPDLVDKWRIYQIAKYCDELVPDGLGGMEPRFTMNGVMNTREAAYQVITQLSAAFRGVTYWGAGAVVPVQDAPSDPVKIVTNANVVGGAFNYAGTGLSARKTAVVASYRHAEDHFKVKAGLVFEDHDAIQRYGRRQTDATLPFTSSRGEALRTAKWIVDTNLTSKETVNYQAGFDHAAIRPGDKLLISDKHRIGFRVGGRIAGVASDRLSVTLDAPVSIHVGESYQLLIATDVGEYVTVDVDAEPGEDVSDLALVSVLPPSVTAGAVFVLSATDMEPRLFRVVSNTPDKHLFNIVALEDDAEKYDRVELGINVAEDPPYVLPTSDTPSAPTGLTLQAFLMPDPGSKSKFRLLASWAPSENPLVTRYLVRIKEPTGSWRDVDTISETSIEITPRRDDAGEYQVRVHALTVIGEYSPFASKSVQNNNVFPRPLTPSGWQAEPGFDSITLWGYPHPAPDFKAFIIYGATADDPTLIKLDEITTTRYVRRVTQSAVITRYAVAAINHNGDESFPTAFMDVFPQPPGIGDLDVDVTQAIDTAQAAADLAAQDATQALLDAATVQDNLTNAVASLSVDYTAVQIAAQAAEDAQFAAETAENSAAEHRGVVVSTAIDLLPSDFRDDDRYWSHTISGDPAAKGGVTSSIGFRDVAGQGRVAWVTADLASNAHLAPKGYISPIQGRRYRMTIVARHLGPLGAGPHFSSQWRKFNENYGFEGSFGQQNISFATQDTWETFASDYTMSGDDAAYLFAFPYFIAAYQNPSAEIEIARVLIEDVTESAGAAGAASAAANSASVAGASETEAGQSAAAAQTAKTAAETARAGAEVAQTTAATSASDAENAAASAATSANIAARIGPRGACVIDDPLFDSYQQGGWNAWQTAPVALPNEVYPTGNTLHFDIGAVNAGTYIANSSTWSGAQNADAYVVEVEFTLLSGAVTGAGVLLDWDVPGDRRRQIPLSDMLRDPVTIGQVTVAQAVFIRPDMGGATFVDHDLYLMANFSSFGLTAKNIKFHRMSVRVATNEELGQGQVASQISAAVTDEAIARASAVDALTSVLTSQQSQIDGISSSVTQQGTTLATLDGKVQAMTGLTATTVDVNGETRISGIQATSYANPDGSGGSLLKLIGDDVVAEGTLSANKLVVGLGKNLLGNTDFADGLQAWDNKGGFGSGREDASIGLRAAGTSWAGKYYPTLVVYQASAGTDGYLDITYRPAMVNGVAPAYGVSISDNTGWVEASVYASAHRCIVELRMEFRNHNGDVLSYTPLLASTTAMSDAGNPDKWPRLWGKAAVPTGAAYVTIHIRKKATNAGSNDSWMFLHKPQLAETTGSAIHPAPYSPQGSTLINGNRLATGAVTADKIDVNELSAVSANIGHFKSATSGERVEIEDDRIRVFDSSDVARVVIGRLN